MEKYNTLVKNLGEQFDGIKVKTDEIKVDIEAGVVKRFETLDHQLKAWSITFRQGLQDEFSMGGRGSGESSEGKGKGGEKYHRSGLDKKDLAVWKAADGISKADFRHWVEAIDNNLEAIHGWNKADLVLDRIRREETEVNADS